MSNQKIKLKYLIFGGSGQAGSEFLTLSKLNGHEEYSPARNQIDITDHAKVRHVIEEQNPDWIINFTAYHVLAECEDNFLTALNINCAAIRNLALIAKEFGSKFLTVSTDYIFDGTKNAPYLEDDLPCPRQAYGVSKLAGEWAALTAHPKGSYVVRTCGLYGAALSKDRGGNFVEKRLAEAANLKQMSVGSDLTCTPTSAKNFAAGLMALTEQTAALPGIYHLTNEGACNWAEFTQEIMTLAGLNCEIIPVDRGGDYGQIKRPAFSVLKNTKAANLGIMLPHWKDALKEYIMARPAPNSHGEKNYVG